MRWLRSERVRRQRACGGRRRLPWFALRDVSVCVCAETLGGCSIALTGNWHWHRMQPSIFIAPQRRRGRRRLEADWTFQVGRGQRGGDGRETAQHSPSVYIYIYVCVKRKSG